jgi:type II pantothenate kinase
VYDAGGVLIYKTLKASEPIAFESDVKYAFTGASGGKFKASAPEDSVDFPEFECTAIGTARITGLEAFLMVGMGTGTSFVRVENGGEKSKHLGGSGLGGGTLCGLWNAKTGEYKNVEEISKIAADGDLSHTDMRVMDILGGGLDETDLLNGAVTVSNLQRLDKFTSEADFAAGIINVITESILTMAIFAAKENEKIVCVGGLSRMCQMRKMAKHLEEMHKVEFAFPEAATYAGAIGCLQKLRNT